VTDNLIPPAFRSALDEPAPPEPPESEPERGDDDGGHHVQFLHPVVMLLSNGGMQTTGWKGTLIQGWCWGSSLVTLVLLGRGVWGWISGGWPIGFREGLFIGAITVALVLVAIFSAARSVLHPNLYWRLVSVATLMAVMFMLSVLIVRAWLP
jgi:hypothetical protein